MLGKAISRFRLFAGLRGFLNNPISYDEARAMLARRLEERGENFLYMLQQCVYGNPSSPYLPLLKEAQCTHEDVAADVRLHGVEGALNRLKEAGVWVSFEEYKGRKPIVRGRASVEASGEAFNNPGGAAGYSGRSGGSTGRPVATSVRLDHHVKRAAYESVMFRMLDLYDVPFALWYPQLPADTGFGNSLRDARAGRAPDRWFDLLSDRQDKPGWEGRLMTWALVRASRLSSNPLAAPEPAGLGDVDRVLDWVLEQLASHGRCGLQSYVSQGVRLSHAARQRGAGLRGATFIIGSEPLTAAKAHEIEQSGARFHPRYSSSDLGHVGLGCCDPAEVGDLHLAEDMIAMIQDDQGQGGHEGRVYYFTSLMESTPKVAINLELGDCGRAEERRCACLLDEIGFHRHLLDVRSISCVTCEGMTVPVAALVRIVEEVLCPKYGGSALHYQWVEQEDERSYTRLRLRVDPRIGQVDGGRIVADVLNEFHRLSQSSRIVAGVWRGAGTVEVIRESPRPTTAGKTLPFMHEKAR